MKKILQKITTGSPIIDGVIVITLFSLCSWVVQALTDFPLWSLLISPIEVPFGILVVLTSLSAIFVKRYLIHSKLNSLLVNRKYSLIFNADDRRNKEIGFGANGKIVEGQNDNEYSWRINLGKLEIFGSDGRIYSRFRYDKNRDEFLQTNDPDRRSLKNQVIVPVKGNTRDWASEKG